MSSLKAELPHITWKAIYPGRGYIRGGIEQGSSIKFVQGHLGHRSNRHASACAVHVQAMISGAFSIVKQSIALGCFPRLDIKHTSERFGGQIYIPAVNWTLMVLTVAVVAGFQSGTAIGNG